MTEAVAQQVLRYYERVDAGDIPGILSLFAANATYARPGYSECAGRDQIEHFYREERIIGAGTHTIDSVVSSGCEVAVRGQFNGLLRDGRHVTLRFADFFVLTPEMTFAHRETFFFAPLA
jgi:steroid delta-isomerase